MYLVFQKERVNESRIAVTANNLLLLKHTCYLVGRLLPFVAAVRR